MEVLASRKTNTRVKLKFRTLLPQHAGQNLQWTQLVPPKWDIITLSPRRLITVGAKYFDRELENRVGEIRLMPRVLTLKNTKQWSLRKPYQRSIDEAHALALLLTMDTYASK